MFKIQMKVALKEGGGPPPGYKWSVLFLSVAEKEAKFLASAEYWHVVDEVKALAEEEDPVRPKTVSVDSVEEVYELRIKGGPLHKKNVRLFFIVHERAIVIVGCIKKETDGSTPPATKRLMKVRRRKYLAGDYSRSRGK